MVYILLRYRHALYGTIRTRIGQRNRPRLAVIFFVPAIMFKVWCEMMMVLCGIGIPSGAPDFQSGEAGAEPASRSKTEEENND